MYIEDSILDISKLNDYNYINNSNSNLNKSPLQNLQSIQRERNRLNISPKLKNENTSNVNLSPVVNKNTKKFETPSHLDRKNIFSAIGMDVLNSNRVMMNFNRKNYLAGAKILPSPEKKKNYVIPKNNIVIKDYEPITEKKINNIIPKIKKMDEEVSTTKIISSPSQIEEKNTNFTMINDFTNIPNISDLSILNNSVINNSVATKSIINEKPISIKKPKLNRENLKMNLLNLSNNNPENYDNTVNFLREISIDNSSFNNHLRMFELFLDIEICVENFGVGSLNNLSNISHLKKPNLFATLKKFFYLCKHEYNPSSQFFLFDSLNKMFEKFVKIQILVLSSILVALNNLVIDSSTKSQIKKLITGLINPIINFYDIFIFGQVNLNYNYVYSKILRPDFSEKYGKIFKNYRMNKGIKTSDLVSLITKNLENVFFIIKQFSK
jgi:hypothetical protein